MDARWIYRQSLRRNLWALDTESTGLNPYRVGWKLRTFQFGDDTRAYVLPARFKRTIRRVVTRKGVVWIGHNGPHDIRCLSVHCGPLDITCGGETYIPAHARDSRNRAEGGTGHGLKELAIADIDPTAGRWEAELKKVFKTIRVPIPGEVYKSGPRKGTQKMRTITLSEGWGLIDPTHPAYVAYAASDPVLTFREWHKLKHVAKANRELYDFDKRVQDACNTLTVRGMPLDIPYTQRLSRAYLREANRLMERASTVYGCANVQSGQQVAETLLRLGVELIERTDSGDQWKTDGAVLRGIMKSTSDSEVLDFIRCVLGAKQLMKRRESYTEQMLSEVDSRGRIHPSINSLGARTTRMSVSAPPLQQLPTKDNENELGEREN
jgi:DNA polymerase I